MTKTCFECGEDFNGEGVLCSTCTARRERGKTIKPLKRRTCLGQLMDALGVIVALITM